MANHWFKKTPSDTVLPAPEHLEYVDDGAAAVLLTTPTRARVLLWACFLFFVSAIVWAAWAELDEVTVGQGKVIPSRQLQVIQNLEGGIVKEIFVKEGDIVEKGQPLLRIDDTRFKSDFREREQELVTLKGDIARLRAEIRSVVVKNEPNQGESVNILLNFTQFFETRIEYRFQIFTAHSCDFLLPSYARLA